VKIIISEQLNYIFKRFVLLMGAGKGEREVMVDRYCLNMLKQHVKAKRSTNRYRTELLLLDKRL
jgi:site-specific recombinase XerD